MGEETDIQVQERQKVLNEMNPKKFTSRHIIIKISIIKDKEEILKAAGEKKLVMCKEIPISISVDFSALTFTNQKGVA